MITLDEKNKIEHQFLEKYPKSDALIAWQESHNKIPEIINKNNYLGGVEIGVAYGGHSESILKNTNVKKLYGIDPYLNYDEYRNDGQCFEQNVMDDIYTFVHDRLSYYGDRYELIREMSNISVKSFLDDSLDFVYIDGNHFENYIKEDINDWWAKVNVGGVLCGHDYNHPLFPEITDYVNYFSKISNSELFNLGDHVWMIKK